MSESVKNKIDDVPRGIKYKETSLERMRSLEMWVWERSLLTAQVICEDSEARRINRGSTEKWKEDDGMKQKVYY